MKRIFLLPLCAIALLVGACSSDSSLPEASGKASVRAINAISTSPEFDFFIQERFLGEIGYKQGSITARYDDLEYTFNFDVLYAGATSRTRFASQFIDVEVGKDYSLLVSGSLASPTVTVWVGDEASFEDDDTVFEARFAHATASQGALDYYFASPGVAPVPGEQVATLAFGEVTAAVNLPADDYVLTITMAGDPAAVVYTSDTVSIAALGAYIFTSFDGDAGDIAPIFVTAINATGPSIGMPDQGFPPSVEFVNASMDLGTSDIYDDEPLTSLRVTDHAYLDVSNELSIATGANTFYYTPAGDTTVVTLQRTLSTIDGLRYRIIASGAAGDLTTSAVIRDLVPLETGAKLLTFDASNNFEFLNIYVVEAGESIDEVLPRRLGLSAGLPALPIRLAAGSYDIHVTETGEKVTLAGPYRIDVAVGDIVDMIIVDTVDPAVLDALFLSGGPTP